MAVLVRRETYPYVKPTSKESSIGVLPVCRISQYQNDFCSWQYSVYHICPHKY